MNTLRDKAALKEQTMNEKDCPKCSTPMHWKYLESHRCPSCNPYTEAESTPPSVEALQEANVEMLAMAEIDKAYIATLEATNAAQAEQLVNVQSKYDELRDIIDGGSESMTHADAVALLQSSTPTEPRATVELTREEVDALLSQCYDDLRKTGWNGGMGGVTWEHAVVRSVERAINQREAVKPLSAAQGVPEGMVLVQKSMVEVLADFEYDEEDEEFVVSPNDERLIEAAEQARAMLSTMRRSSDESTDYL